MVEVPEAVTRQLRALMQRTVERGCTEAEAAEAMLAIARLLSRYNLDRAQLLEEDETPQFDLCTQEVPCMFEHYSQDWATCMGAAICRLYYCTLLTYEGTQDGQPVFMLAAVGERPNVEAVVAVLSSLVAIGTSTAASKWAARNDPRGPGLFSVYVNEYGNDWGGLYMRLLAGASETAITEQQHYDKYMTGFAKAITNRAMHEVHVRERDSSAIVPYVEQAISNELVRMGVTTQRDVPDIRRSASSPTSDDGFRDGLSASLSPHGMLGGSDAGDV